MPRIDYTDLLDLGAVNRGDIAVFRKDMSSKLSRLTTTANHPRATLVRSLVRQLGVPRILVLPERGHWHHHVAVRA